MKIVLVNVEFKDAYTGKKYVPGKRYEMSEQRVAEVQAVGKHFISVVGDAAEPDEAPEKKK